MENNKTLGAEREWGFQDYLSLAIRRKWIIISIFCLVFSASAAYFFTRPPIYRAGSTFIIESSDKKGGNIAPVIFENNVRPFGFYETLVKSRIFRERIIKAVKNDSTLLLCPDFNDEALKKLLGDLTISETEYDELYALFAEANHPVIAYRFAMISMNEFKRRCQEIELEESRNVVSYVNLQIEEARKNLEHAERDLQEFKERTQISDIDEIEGGLLKKLGEIESQLEDVETQRQLAQANLNTYQAKFGTLKDRQGQTLWNNESPEVQSLRNEIEKLEQLKRKVAEANGISSPQIAAVDAKIELKKNVLRQAVLANHSPVSGFSFSREEESTKDIFNERIINEELNLYTLSNREQFLRSMIDRYRQQNPNILEHAIELAQLQRTKKVNENLYTFLVEKAEEAKINAATGTGGVRVVDEPSLPESPKSSNKKRNIAVAMILAMGLGFGLAFVRDYLDSSIYTVEDIKHIGDFAILGSIPLMKISDLGSGIRTLKNGKKAAINELYYFEDRMNGYRNKVISLIESKEPVVDAYRHVRTNLQFANVDSFVKRILITSSIPGEGKTLTAANLAISFAELGKRVLVVDCDMRKAHQHILFNVRKSPGLSDYMARDLSIEKVVYLTHVPNLYVIPAGTTPPNPAEMLASSKMSDLIRKLEQNFDFVLYDSPPIISVTDPILLSKKVENVVLVVRFGKTSRHLVTDSVSRLKHVNTDVLGIIFNGMERSKGYGYYKYDYSYYQNSYYSEEQQGKKKKFTFVG
ncbi:MAG: polysaccharide biosynthesis tyrosine autokinase [Calditrichaeota bacterium]|nr:MAG: polysaccharide biosynthesis tyrosine autokinase [Calditrichota bacterium]